MLQWNGNVAVATNQYEIKPVDPTRPQNGYHLFVNDVKLRHRYAETTSPRAYAELVEEKEIFPYE